MISGDAEVQFIAAGGTTFRVALRGAGPPLLLMAGIGGNIETWEPLADHLTGRRLIMFDAPGAGRTPALARGTRMRDVARVVGELLTTLGHDRADVLGYSFGGALAQQFAHDSPDRVRRLILAGTLPGLGGIQNPARPVQLLTMVKTRDPEKRRRRMARLLGGRSGRDPEVMAVYERNRGVNPGSAEGYRHQMRTISGWTSLGFLNSLAMPTLVLAARKDPMAPALNARLFCRLMPHAQCHVLEAAGHLFLLDQPDDVAPLIDSFLSEPDETMPS